MTAVRAKEMRELQQVTLTVYTAAQANMASLTRRESEIKSQLAGLVETRVAAANRVQSEPDAAMIAGADLRWHRWIDQRRAILNSELAQLRASKAAVQKRLQKAFGRHEAVRLMQLRAAEPQRQLRARHPD